VFVVNLFVATHENDWQLLKLRRTTINRREKATTTKSCVRVQGIAACLFPPFLVVVDNTTWRLIRLDQRYDEFLAKVVDGHPSIGVVANIVIAGDDEY